MGADEPGAGMAPRTVWGVSALLLATGDALAARFGAVAVRGELGSVTRAASGHCYFSLKDAQGASALLRCAMFRRAASLLDFVPADGQQVELRGRLGVYEPRGELQLVVEAMRRVGAGTLYEEFLRLRARLEAQGVFDTPRKRELPREPRRIGVVTSLGAAALRDVLITLARRAPHVRVVVYPAAVQGADAPVALRAALTLANQRAEVDVLLLVRGGGSLEDLWAFNDESLVRAVAASKLPVVCGVGHETDVTLSDLAADVRAATPTAAAEIAAPLRDELLALLEARRQMIARSVTRLLQTQAQRLDRLGLRFSAPAAALRLHMQRLAEAGKRLQRCVLALRSLHLHLLRAMSLRMLRARSSALESHAQRLSLREGRLLALDPHQVLRRGYAWVTAADGRPVTSVQALSPGQVIQAVWADGQAQASVTNVEARETAPPRG